MKRDFNANWHFTSASGKDETVYLPHDAMMTEERTKDAPGKGASAYFPGGSYIYEKEFLLTEEEAAKHLVFEFEAVYKNAVVCINGREAARHAYGYIGFYVEADGFVQAGANTITVSCGNAEQPDSRWYSGAGITRPVYLHILEQECIEPDGIRIDTLSIEPPTIRIRTAHSGVSVKAKILNPASAVEGEDAASVPAEAEGDDITLTIPGAKLWSADSPQLYTARISLFGTDGSVREVREERFGIRQITWNRGGLFVNGEETKLRGGCIHSDNGVAGARVLEASEFRKVRILKEHGYNAIRSAHDPAPKALLDACDILGMYVMDESWDMWYRKKSKYDYANEFMANYKEDLAAMVAKDYNHPSVILYSIGNEVSEPAEEKGVKLAQEMCSLLHSLDPSRPVTGGFNLMIIKNAAGGKQMYSDEGELNTGDEDKMSGMNSTMFNMIASMVGTGMNKAANGKKADRIVSPLLDSLDIAGYNYASGRYKEDGKLHPDRLIFGSETFPQDLAKNWKMVETYPYLIGDFMWTAWDYIGEAGIGAWSYEADAKGFNKPYPWFLGAAGAIDILGTPGGEALWASAIWKHEPVTMAVQPPNHPGEKLVKGVWRGTNAIPSWSFEGCTGNKTIVEVYTAEPVAELYLNGKKVGRKKTKDCRAVFKVSYEPGTLTAWAIGADGMGVGSTSLKSAVGIPSVRIREEAGGGEISYFEITLADANGTVESNRDRTLKLTVENGELIGFGSANPRTEERFDSGSCTTYYGRAQAIVRKTGEGPVRVTAE